MPWIEQQAKPHPCNKPEIFYPYQASPGDLWQCPECEQIWQVERYLNRNTWKHYKKPVVPTVTGLRAKFKAWFRDE